LHYLSAAIERVRVLSVRVSAYNTFVIETNAAITAKKQSINAGNVQSARNALAILKARKVRFESPTKESCVLYVEQLKQKKLLDTEKEKAKKALDDFGKNVYVDYEQRINELLDRFHTGFRICDTSRRYVGGTASTSYQIVINNVAVDLGDDKTPISTHSFKNTLSSGDRSTLAFAFFVAQVERDPNLSDTIIVFDDPFTSQDRSRRSCTQQIINRLATQAKQVLVLSHDASFLRDVWDSDYTQDIKALQFVRLQGSSVLSEWNITDDTMGDYHRMHGQLSVYFNEGRGDKRHVAQTIRPFLEHWLKFKFPCYVKDDEMLGTFLSSVRHAGASSPLASAKPILNDLEDINGYSKKYHHAFNPQASSEPVDDNELQGFVKRTLALTAG
jgi:wobble nucleotide-excising tRNase